MYRCVSIFALRSVLYLRDSAIACTCRHKASQQAVAETSGGSLQLCSVLAFLGYCCLWHTDRESERVVCVYCMLSERGLAARVAWSSTCVSGQRRGRLHICKLASYVSAVADTVCPFLGPYNSCLLTHWSEAADRSVVENDEGDANRVASSF